MRRPFRSAIKKSCYAFLKQSARSASALALAAVAETSALAQPAESKWLDEFKSNRGAMISAVAMAIGPATDSYCGEAKDPEILKKASVFAMTLGYVIDDAFVNDLKATMTKQIGLMNDHPEPELRRGTCLYAKGVTGMARSIYDIQKKDHPEIIKEVDQMWVEINRRLNLQR
jgi:hypothetical protein